MEYSEDVILGSSRNSSIDDPSASDDDPLGSDSVDSSLDIGTEADQKTSCSDMERVTPTMYSGKLFADSNFEVGEVGNCAFVDLCLDMAGFLDEIEAIMLKKDTIEFIDFDDLQTGSPCQMEWMQYKEETGAENYFVDTIMALPSREDIKYLFLNTVKRVKLAQSVGNDLSEEDFSVVFITRGADDQSCGATAIVRHFAKLLVSLGVIDRSHVRSLDGDSCDCVNSSRCIMGRHDDMGEVFKSRAKYPSDINPRDCILFSNAGDHCGNTDELNAHIPIDVLEDVPILIIYGSMPALDESLGHADSGEEDYAHVPILRLDPFTSEELVIMAKAEFRKQGESRVRYATDIDDNSWQIFTEVDPSRPDKLESTTSGAENFLRMMGIQGPPSESEVDNEQPAGLETISTNVSRALRRKEVRMRNRAKRSRKSAYNSSGSDTWVDQNLLTKSDLIGRRGHLLQPNMSPSYKKLEGLVGRGMQEVRNTILSITHNESQNSQRNRGGVKAFHLPFGRVFLGPAGCGKSTAAELYARALNELGLCNTVTIRSATDLFSENVGGSEEKANKLLDATEAGVLILDDIHVIDPGSESAASRSRIKSVIQLICSHAKRRNGRQKQTNCIILVGDADGVEELYQNVKDSGIDTIFPLDLAIRFDDFADDELEEIFRTKLREKGLSASDEAMQVAIQLLRDARSRPSFGNEHAVENLVNAAISRSHRRVMAAPQVGVTTSSLSVGIDMVLEPQDIDPSYGGLDKADEDLETMFDGFIDLSSVVNTFRNLNGMAKGMQLRGLDPRPFIPFTYIFKGPPGTGKTTSARTLGQIFYNLGFLSSPEVVECSASSLIGQYVGHTGPKLLRQMEKALGKVLFIDEAYRLAAGAHGSSYNDEAIAELVDAVTKPKFARKLIIVLAGYSKAMDKLLMSNPGMQSRFATEIEFRPLTIDGCLVYLRQCVGKVGIEVEDMAGREEVVKRVRTLLAKLSACKNWASARSIEKISERIIGMVFNRCSIEHNATGRLTVAMATVEEVLDNMLQENMKTGRV